MMAYDPAKTPIVEKHLGELVRGVKGVRNIRGCSDGELECYRISFGYQRRVPLKDYLLIYDPNESILTMCADGGIGRPPQNVRRRLLERLGGEKYKEEAWAYKWSDISIDILCNT